MKRACLILLLSSLWPVGPAHAQNPPSTPVLHSPADASTPFNFTGVKKLNWSPSTDPLGGNITYDLYLGESNDPPLFRADLFEGWVGSGGQEYAATATIGSEGTFFEFQSVLPLFNPETTYYWRVVAKNETGDQQSSTTFSFTMPRENDLPSMPTLRSPSDGQDNISRTGVTLEWAPSVDPDGDLVTYNVYFGDSQVNTTFQPLVASGITGTTYSIPGPLDDQKDYYWKVHAVDGYNGRIVTHDGTNSTWRFTVENYVPDPPVTGSLTAPLDGSTNVTRTVTFRWDAATDKDNDALTYDLYADQDPDPKTLLAEGLTTTSFDHTFDTYGAHYWKVVVNDGTGLSNESAVFSFTTWGEGPDFEVEMVDMEGGRFIMGQSDMQEIFIPQFGLDHDIRDENPAHEVVLDDYRIAKYETINQHYVSFLNAIAENTGLVASFRAHRRLSFPYRNVTYKGHQLCQVYDATRTDRPVGYEETYDSPIIWNGTSFELDPNFEDHPVRFMYYQGAYWFARWLGYRVPTEAEWEYAAMGGKQGQGYTYSGSNDYREVAVHNVGAPIDVPRYTGVIGTKAPNELGIYDMTGNVQEICEDFYSPNYYGTGPVNNPVNTVPSGGLGRVARGGTFSNPSEVYMRVKSRFRLSGAQYIDNSGIRLAASMAPDTGYGMSGTVRDAEGNSMQGVRIQGFTEMVETDEYGNFSTTETSGWSGTLSPELSGYTFTPENRVINDVRADQSGIDFTANPIPQTYEIAGRITDEKGNPLEGVAITGLSENTMTDANGDFSAFESQGWSGTLVPELAEYTFSPENRAINTLQKDETGMDFVGTANTLAFTISGKVLDQSGNPVPNVKINGFPGTIETDEGGHFITNEAEGWSGTILPELAGYTFEPESVQVDNLDNDLTALEFVAKTDPVAYTLSGTIADIMGNPLGNVTINGLSGDVITGSDGGYKGQEASGWSGVISPELQGYTFVPESIVVTNLSSDRTSLNFTAIALPKEYVISGTIIDGNGDPVENAALKGFTEDVVSDMDGRFGTTESRGWSGLITPELEGYRFEPETAEIDNLDGDRSLDFKAVPISVGVPSQTLIYPNPGEDGEFTIAFPQPESIRHIRIFSSTGRLVRQLMVNGTFGSYTVEHALPTDLYTVEVQTGKDRFALKLLIR